MNATAERTDNGFLRPNGIARLHSGDVVRSPKGRPPEERPPEERPPEERKMSSSAAIAALQKEHSLFERVIAGIARLADEMRNGRPADPDVLSGLVEFVRVFGDERHHRKEDGDLFPLLESRGVPAEGCPLASLKNEHEKSRSLISQLSDAAEAYVATDGRTKDALIRTFDGLVELYPSHIWKEEYLLFPLAEKVLSSEELQQLAESFDKLDAEVDPRLHDRMEQFADRFRFDFHAGPQRAPQPTAGPYLEFNLADAAERLRHEPAWSTGRNSRTMLKYADFRIVLIVLRAQHRMEEHHTDANISVQTLSGHMRVRAGGRLFDMPAGDLLALERGMPHDVEAVEDSAFLLTIAWPPGGRGQEAH